MDQNLKISIALPVHEMQNWEFFLRRVFASIILQTYKNYEVIITDNSDSNNIFNVCKEYRNTDFPHFFYRKNPNKGMAQNTNEAIKLSTGDIIKIIYLDDYFAHKDALKDIVEAFKGEWMATGCLHDNGYGAIRPHPASFSGIMSNQNTIGSPSVVAIKNRREDNLMFDEKMTWLLDVDYYKRMYLKYGEPTILPTMNVVIGLHTGQATNTMGEERKQQEEEYIKSKQI
jgi:glycosyltransferase involved in cell wall biosynthesis